MRLLCWIRLFALTGQSIAISVAQFRLGLDLDYGVLWVVMLSMWCLGIYSWNASGSDRGVSESSYGLNLALEVFGFSILIYLSGGATNPFVFYYLVPLAVGVATLSKRNAWLMAIFCIGIYTLLMFQYRYLALFDMSHGLQLMSSHDMSNMADVSSGVSWKSPHILGMWMNFVGSALLITYFISRMADQIRSQERELASKDQRRREDEHLLAMGTFAAGTAHELGTPLSTLAIILQDLADQPGLPNDQNQELKIACGEVDRCRTILQSLVNAAHLSQTSGDRSLDLDTLLGRLKDQAKNLFPESKINQSSPAGLDLVDIKLRSDTALEQSLLNLYANAIEASRSQGLARIEVRAELLHNTIRIIIRDYGPGLSAELQEKLGRILVSNKPEGLGIGYFLANAAIDRIGGALSIRNLSDGGAETQIELPREKLADGSPAQDDFLLAGENP